MFPQFLRYIYQTAIQRRSRHCNTDRNILCLPFLAFPAANSSGGEAGLIQMRAKTHTRKVGFAQKRLWQGNAGYMPFPRPFS